MQKTCTKCGETKEYSEFFKNSANKGTGHCARCKKCMTEENSHYKKKESNKHYKEQQIKWSTGVSGEEYRKLVEHYDNCCAICGKTEENNNKRLSIDHCHTTNRVRGLLCSTCNLGLGAFQDSRELLISAISYLSNNLSYENIMFESKYYKRK